MTKTNTFHDQIEKSMTFQVWKTIFQNSMTYQVFHDPYEPCYKVLPIDRIRYLYIYSYTKTLYP